MKTILDLVCSGCDITIQAPLKYSTRDGEYIQIAMRKNSKCVYYHLNPQTAMRSHTADPELLLILNELESDLDKGDEDDA